MARNTRRRYQREVLVCEDALTTSRDLNVAGLASAIALCTELLTDYAAHVADQGASAGEHKALHTAGQLASAVAPYNLTTLFARVNDLQAKYALHNTDAAAATPTYHMAQATSRALANATTVTTLNGAIAKLNDIKAKYNLHDASGAGAHRAGGLQLIAAADSALGAAIKVTAGMEDVKLGDRVSWSILKSGTGTVTGVSAVACDRGVTFTFSADPQDDAIISYTVAAQ